MMEEDERDQQQQIRQDDANQQHNTRRFPGVGNKEKQRLDEVGVERKESDIALNGFELAVQVVAFTNNAEIPSTIPPPPDVQQPMGREVAGTVNRLLDRILSIDGKSSGEPTHQQKRYP